ncbi:MAG: hypothetical protein AAF153_00290, partial [Pseudomonadota bacterium]
VAKTTPQFVMLLSETVDCVSKKLPSRTSKYKDAVTDIIEQHLEILFNQHGATREIECCIEAIKSMLIFFTNIPQNRISLLYKKVNNNRNLNPLYSLLLLKALKLYFPHDKKLDSSISSLISFQENDNPKKTSTIKKRQSRSGRRKNKKKLPDTAHCKNEAQEQVIVTSARSNKGRDTNGDVIDRNYIALEKTETDYNNSVEQDIDISSEPDSDSDDDLFRLATNQSAGMPQFSKRRDVIIDTSSSQLDGSAYNPNTPILADPNKFMQNAKKINSDTKSDGSTSNELSSPISSSKFAEAEAKATTPSPYISATEESPATLTPTPVRQSLISTESGTDYDQAPTPANNNNSAQLIAPTNVTPQPTMSSAVAAVEEYKKETYNDISYIEQIKNLCQSGDANGLDANGLNTLLGTTFNNNAPQILQEFNGDIANFHAFLRDQADLLINQLYIGNEKLAEVASCLKVIIYCLPKDNQFMHWQPKLIASAVQYYDNFKTAFLTKELGFCFSSLDSDGKTFLNYLEFNDMATHVTWLLQQNLIELTNVFDLVLYYPAHTTFSTLTSIFYNANHNYNLANSIVNIIAKPNSCGVLLLTHTLSHPDLLCQLIAYGADYKAPLLADGKTILHHLAVNYPSHYDQAKSIILRITPPNEQIKLIQFFSAPDQYGWSSDQYRQMYNESQFVNITANGGCESGYHR